MNKARLSLTLLLVLILTLAIQFLLRERQVSAQILHAQQGFAGSDVRALTLVFGSKDPSPSPWDGSASLSSGKIEKIEGYHFNEKAEMLPANAWRCATSAWGTFSGGMHPNEKPQPFATPVEPTGVTIYYRAPEDALLTVKVPKGEFTVRLADIPNEGGLFPLNATVELYRSPVVEPVTGSAEDDYPSIAAEGDQLWVAWQAYGDKADQVMLRSRKAGKWSEALTVTERPGDLFGAAAAALGAGKVMVVWSEREGQNWHLKSRVHDGAAFGAVETLTAGTGNNLFHRAAGDGKGSVHVAWQSWRGGRSDIYMRSYAGGSWKPEINLSDPKRHARANDWSPAVALARDGTVWVAWDGYATGSYNISMRGVKAGRAGELLRVTDSRRTHLHASLAVDAQDRVWVAWDEAPENWGKDVGFLLTGGTGLYETRDIRVAVYAAGRWQAPLSQPGANVPYGFRRYFQTPRLLADAAGRIWLFARPRTSAKLPTSLWAAGGKWEVTATHYDGDRWSELMVIPEAVGRNEGEMQLAPGPGGAVHAVWVSDHRLWGGPNFGHPPRNNDIMFTTVNAPGGKSAELGARGDETPGMKPTEPRESEQVARLRSHVIESGGKRYRIYRGDMHRHTDISLDGAGDGSLWDAYRYAMDAAALDYFLVTDHQSGQQEYTWWRIEKSADMFHVPGFFTALYGTERSLSYPNGHRNLVFAQRGVPILEITQKERDGNTGPILYPYLKQYKGIATSHTSHTGMGTDWRDNDGSLEPVVEIFQGARTSAEHEGAPLAPTEQRTELHAGGYRPLGFVWNAWKKGYRLGVQSSSDHVSTHTSYSAVIAEGIGREDLVNALRQRHTYAATTNILLDYRLTLDGKPYLQGDIAAGSGIPELTARIVGAGPLKKVDVVRDNQYVYSQQPAGETFDLRFRENELAPGEHYYYVRVEQKDGRMAWSSPIWVKR